MWCGTRVKLDVKRRKTKQNKNKCFEETNAAVCGEQCLRKMVSKGIFCGNLFATINARFGICSRTKCSGASAACACHARIMNRKLKPDASTADETQRACLSSELRPGASDLILSATADHSCSCAAALNAVDGHRPPSMFKQKASYSANDFYSHLRTVLSPSQSTSQQ